MWELMPDTPEARKELTLNNPAYINAKKSKSPRARFVPKTIQMYIVQGDKLLVPSGYYYSKCFPSYFHPILPVVELKVKKEIKLYDYQERAIKRAIDYSTGAIIVSPTGTGKTQMAIELIHRLSMKTLWITHTKDLLTQSKNRFSTYFSNKVGTITEGKIDLQDITFATIQTLASINLDLIKDYFYVIVIDEVQHVATNVNHVAMFEKVLAKLDYKYIYGLTATFHRADHLEKAINILCSYDMVIVPSEETRKYKATYKPIVLEYKVGDIIVGKDIVSGLPIYKAPYLNADGTINYSSLISSLSSLEARNEYIINMANNLMGCGRNIMILCALKSHCELLNSRISNSVYLDSKLSATQRKEVINNVCDNTYHCLIATYSLAKEGLDIPILDTLILATPVSDETILIQSIGRIEREKEGKPKPIVYDLVDFYIPYCLGKYKKRLKILRGKNYEI